MGADTQEAVVSCLHRVYRFAPYRAGSSLTRVTVQNTRNGYINQNPIFH
jgi:hypothetical protein